MKNKKLVGKIIDYTLNILIVIFAVFLLISMYTAFQVKVLGNEYSNFFGYSLFEVQTGSMHGTIEAGDWIIIKNGRDVNIGDIVTYRHGKDFVTHRIIESYKGTYVTKGDANNAKDDPIDQSQIVGHVVKILHGFGILRKVCAVAVASVLAAGCLTACGSSKNAGPLTLDQIKENGKLTVATEAAYEPFE